MLHDSHFTAAQYIECLTRDYAPRTYGAATPAITTVYIDGVFPVELTALQSLIANGIVKVVKNDGDAA